MVWYLSRATGAPCPFARAGIRLCDYGQSASIQRDNKKPDLPDHHESCGQKRKRSLRSAYPATSDSPTISEESDHGSPPPKVKLTLRLKPPTNPNTSPDPESDASMSTDDSDPQQPNESCPPHSPLYHRSPSLAHSVSSPPPESDDEEDDNDSSDDDDDNNEEDEDEEEETEEVSVTQSTRNFYSFSEDQDHDDQDWDDEVDGDTLWESPGPRSPSASLPETKVKEEPTDVQGMLDAWDHFDSSVADAKVVQVIAQAAAVLNPDTIHGSATVTLPVKVESLDPWAWEPSQVPQGWTLGLAEETIQIKQEELDLGFDSLFPGLGEWQGEWQDQDSQYRDTAKEQVKTSPLSHAPTLFPDSSFPLSPYVTTPVESISTISPGLVQLIQALSVQSPTTPHINGFSQPHESPDHPSILPPPASIPPSSLVLVPTSPILPAQQPCVSPQIMKSCPIVRTDDAEGIVVHTCQPRNPPISATQIEGEPLTKLSNRMIIDVEISEISVYQMALGPYLLLRRIDTDFVNLTPIVESCGKGRGYPVMSTVPNAVIIGKGEASAKVVGVWVPLQVAQAYVKDLDTCSIDTETMEGLNLFLNDELVEWFPSALKDFHRTNSSGRMLKQFGRWFESMLIFAQATAAASMDMTVANCTANGSLNPQEVMQADMRQNWMYNEPVVHMTDTFPLGDVLVIKEGERFAVGLQPSLYPRRDSSQLHRRTGSELRQEVRLDCDSPLSAKEQEIFHELCVIPGEEEERMKVEEGEEKMVDVEVCTEEKQEDIPKIVVSGGDGGAVNIDLSMLAMENGGVQPVLSSPKLFQAFGQPVLSRVSHSLSEAGEDSGADSSSNMIPIAARTRSTRIATMSKVNEKQEQKQPQVVRRSKRVAAAQMQQEKKKSKMKKRLGSRDMVS